MGNCSGTMKMESGHDRNLRKHQIKEGTLFTVSKPTILISLSLLKRPQMYHSAFRQSIKTPLGI